jgi:hypothetical protein
MAGTRRTTLLALALVCATAGPAVAKRPTGSPGGPASLKFWRMDGTATTTGFTAGPSADAGKAAVTMDGGSAQVQPSDIFVVTFEGWRGQALGSVTGLSIATQDPVTSTSPRIVVSLSSTPDLSSGNDRGSLTLSPGECGASVKGWRTSNWRSGTGCTIRDDRGHAYSGAGSAWDAMLQSGDHAGEYVHYAYVIQDQQTRSRVDRITLDGQVFTK